MIRYLSLYMLFFFLKENVVCVRRGGEKEYR
jgi:hypothetical protein